MLRDPTERERLEQKQLLELPLPSLENALKEWLENNPDVKIDASIRTDLGYNVLTRYVLQGPKIGLLRQLLVRQPDPSYTVTQGYYAGKTALGIAKERLLKRQSNPSPYIKELYREQDEIIKELEDYERDPKSAFGTVSTNVYGDFLGSGSYGCVLYPALTVGKVVSESNKLNFVTKIAWDAEEEYDTAIFIATQAPDSGVYPVELICGITRASLDPRAYARLQEECKEPLSIGTPKRQFFGGAAFSDWCAIQYPKYYTTFPETDHSFSAISCAKTANLLLNRLNALHAKNIFHLDIKDENLALMEEPGPNEALDVKFADWGFSVVLTGALARNATDELTEFMVKSFSWIGSTKIFVYHKKLIRFPELQKIHKDLRLAFDNIDLDFNYIETALEYMRMVDTLCTFSLLLEFMTTNKSSYDYVVNEIVIPYTRVALNQIPHYEPFDATRTREYIALEGRGTGLGTPSPKKSPKKSPKRSKRSKKSPTKSPTKSAKKSAKKSTSN